MIAFFPEIYPDELLYSQIARYHVRSGHARYRFTFEDIYKNNTTVHPDVEFVNKYTPEAMVWMTKNKPWEDVLAQHTMYPAYIRFLPKMRRNEAVRAISVCEGNWKNLMAMPNIGEKRYIRYCPVCAEEDRKVYGETYWHRAHQIRRIRVCPKHGCFLKDSGIPISSKASPKLYDAESCVPKENDIEICANDREISFTQYVIDVMGETIDLENALPVGRFLHSRLNDEYINESGLVRDVAKLYRNYVEFYGEGIQTMTFDKMRKIFNGFSFDPYFVLQLAYFQGVSVEDITHLPTDIPLYGIEQTYKKLSEKHGIDYTVVADIGRTVLNYSHQQNNISRKSGPRAARYDELDIEYLPKVKNAVDEIMNCDGKPQKLSYAKVQKELNLPRKQINKFPKCKAYIDEYMETQAEYWAREVIWAVKELESEDRPVNISRIMKKTNMRHRDIESCCPYISDLQVQGLIGNMLYQNGV